MKARYKRLTIDRNDRKMKVQKKDEEERKR
jgi:hypothetical protein